MPLVVGRPDTDFLCCPITDIVLLVCWQVPNHTVSNPSNVTAGDGLDAMLRITDSRVSPDHILTFPAKASMRTPFLDHEDK
ncbi:hypothetical protein JG688_00012916 [Phytophthora aleatoria]|uniref:Uncharacterized protein n=1 Tax=Phytophthora aleatoria TaxID=2496075 RepID=A0A8J5IA40_9STRA|nr:hypothetical protein JG688_00012916 [Phytophthora aleatoria]